MTAHRNPHHLDCGTGLRQRLIRGFGATATGPIVTATIQLGSVPILLHIWGIAKYGDWLLLSAIPSYLTLSDLGLGDASGRDMAMRVAAGDRKGALQSFESSWVLVTSVSFAVLLLASTLVWWIPWQSWLRLYSLSSMQAAAVIMILGSYVVVCQQNGITESGYRADGYFARGTLYSTMLRLLEVVLATIVAALGGSLLLVACTYLGTRLLGTAGYILLLRSTSPWIQYGIRHVRLESIRQLTLPAFGFMAFPLGQAFSFRGFTILLGAMVGPLAVVSFSTLRTLSRISVQVLSMVPISLWPELSRVFGQGNICLARRLHRLAWQASLILSLLGAMLLWIVGPFIYRLWVRQGVSFNSSCFRVLLLVAVMTCLWNASSVILMSVNDHFRIASTYVAVTALSLVLGSIFIRMLGITGAALALLLTEGWMTALVLRSALRHLQDSTNKFFRAIIAIDALMLQSSPDS